MMSKNSLMDEKKRLEARVNALEDEMEEEAGNAELSIEKARKLQSQVTKVTTSQSLVCDTHSVCILPFLSNCTIVVYIQYSRVDFTIRFAKFFRIQYAFMYLFFIKMK